MNTPNWIRTLRGGLLAFALLPTLAFGAPKKLLVVTVTTGFRHSSISTAEKVLTKLAEETHEFTVDFVQQPPNEPRPPQEPKLPKDPSAEDQQKFQSAQAAYATAQKEYTTKRAAWDAEVKSALSKLDAAGLKKYDGVIFANTTGDLPLPDNNAFMAWLKSGKAFIGMHSASDTFHGFRPYIEMIGSEFKTHGAQATVECLNQDPQHPACKHLASSWTVHDEIYIMQSFERPRVHGLLSLDKHPNQKTPGDYPIAWCRNYGKGHVFYTSLGHREDVWENPVYQKHILGGIRWALGLQKKKVTHAP
ncbi:MAG TPA: ThuA domain-containing protein [Verrucomicrobiales bacterium]|nr:ThuA domain-containing protein [Verrucomicrobiales bacterium]